MLNFPIFFCLLCWYTSLFYMLTISAILHCQFVFDRLKKIGVLFDFLLIEKMDQRNSIQFCVKNEIKCARTFEMSTAVFGDLASHIITCIVCDNFINKWRYLQFNVDSQWQIFFENLFMSILFLFYLEFLAEIC